MNPTTKASAQRGVIGSLRVAAALLSASMLLVLSVTVSADSLREKMTTTLSDFAGQPIVIEYARPSPAPGISEVQIENGPLIYATDDGAYFFLNGDLHQANATGAVNLTETRRAEARQQQLATVSVDDMIVFAPEGPSRAQITVFTDVTCFYCQKLHREVDQLNAEGIEVRYLAFPRSGIESEGAEKLATAWCADDQQTALTELKAGVALPVNMCEGNPIAAQYELGKEMGVSGTPAIVTSSGELVPGYRPAAALVALLGLD